jgi:hypothetical protein
MQVKPCRARFFLLMHSIAIAYDVELKVIIANFFSVIAMLRSVATCQRGTFVPKQSIACRYKFRKAESPGTCGATLTALLWGDCVKRGLVSKV